MLTSTKQIGPASTSRMGVESRGVRKRESGASGAAAHTQAGRRGRLTLRSQTPKQSQGHMDWWASMERKLCDVEQTPQRRTSQHQRTGQVRPLQHRQQATRMAQAAGLDQQPVGL